MSLQLAFLEISILGLTVQLKVCCTELILDKTYSYTAQDVSVLCNFI